MVINYRLSFVWYSNSKILKLPIPSNERGFNGKITVLFQPLPLPLKDSITVYYQFVPLNRYWSAQIAHACFRPLIWLLVLNLVGLQWAILVNKVHYTRWCNSLKLEKYFGQQWIWWIKNNDILIVWQSGIIKQWISE